MPIFCFLHFAQRHKTSRNITNEWTYWPMTKPCLKNLTNSYFRVAYNRLQKMLLYYLQFSVTGSEEKFKFILLWLSLISTEESPLITSLWLPIIDREVRLYSLQLSVMVSKEICWFVILWLPVMGNGLLLHGRP